MRESWVTGYSLERNRLSGISGLQSRNGPIAIPFGLLGISLKLDYPVSGGAMSISTALFTIQSSPLISFDGPKALEKP